MPFILPAQLAHSQVRLLRLWLVSIPDIDHVFLGLVWQNLPGGEPATVNGFPVNALTIWSPTSRHICLAEHTELAGSSTNPPCLPAASTLFPLSLNLGELEFTWNIG